MIFKGVNNQAVELRIHNYEFPNTLDKEYDGNWLRIYLNVKSDLGNWQTIDPSLLTYEVQKLVEWFRCIADNKEPEYIEQEFIEPNIAFYLLNSYLQDEKQIKIKFDLESRPQSAKDDIEYYVILKADRNELNRIATELEQELKIFPERK